MQLCLITPMSAKRFVEHEPVHLTLAHLVGNNEYTKFYKEQAEKGAYIYMDNGTFEGKLIEDFGQLVDKALQIGAHCITAPDYPGRPWQWTVEKALAFRDYLETLDLKSRFEILAVPQVQRGTSALDDFIRSYTLLGEAKGIDRLSISILSAPHAYERMLGDSDPSLCRVGLVKFLQKRGLVCKKKHHFLGLHRIHEVYLQQLYGVADTLDTSSPIWHGIKGIRYQYSAKTLGERAIYNIPGGKLKEKCDFDIDITEEMAPDIECNIKILKHLARGGGYKCGYWKARQLEEF